MSFRPKGTVGSTQDVLLTTFAIRMGLGVLVTAALARALGTAGFGFVSYVGTVLLLSHVILDLGTGVVATREIAANPAEERAVLARLLGFRVLSSAIVLLSLLGMASVEQGSTERTVLLLCALLAPSLALGAACVPLNVRQRPHGPALTGVLSQLALLALLWFVPFGAEGIPEAWAAMLLMLREVVNVSATVWFGARACGGFPRPCFGRELLSFARLAWPQGRFALLQAAWFHADVFLVRGLCGEEVLGHYAAAYRPVVPLLLVPGMMALPLLPVLARSTEAEAITIVRRLSALMLGLGAIGAVAALLAPAALLRLLYPDAVATQPETVASLRWLGVAFALAFVSTPLLTALVALRRERALILVGLAALLLNVGANLLLTGRGGAVAAAAITAATEACVAIGALFLWSRRWGQPADALVLRALAPAGLLGAVLALAQWWGWELHGATVLLLCGAALAAVLLQRDLLAARHALRDLGRS